MGSLKHFIESLPEIVLQTGSPDKEPEQILLTAGNLTMLYSSGSISNISVGSAGLIQRIYPAVRDSKWLTLSPIIQDERTDIRDHSFTIYLKCLYLKGGINFTADYVIEGSEEGFVTLTMNGKALSDFERNRIGFCILHSSEDYAGRNCQIEHTDGSREDTLFPHEISPRQVFSEIKSMAWQSGNIKCKIEFLGDIFETEDQRNWTDASFKTYSTPLSLPYPVSIEKNTVIYQQVTFRSEGTSGRQKAQSDTTSIRLLFDETSRMPLIGICRPGGKKALSRNEIRILRTIRFDHYRIDLHLFENDWTGTAGQAASEAADLGYDPEFALFFDDNYKMQVRSFAEWYSGNKFKHAVVLPFHRFYPCTPENISREVNSVLKSRDPSLKTGSGTNANFAQLNRTRPAEAGHDFICYSIQPQEHASDNTTLIENLAAQAYTVISARKFGGNADVAISPVTIQRRFNANNTFVEMPWEGSDPPPQIDSRLMSLFGGCWITGSLRYLCGSGAARITYCEAAGERGIMMGETDSGWPSYFHAVRSMIFPSFHVFKFLLSNKSFRIVNSISSEPLAADCVALTDGRQVRIILVNYTDRVRKIRFECCSGLFRLRALSTESYFKAASNYNWKGIEDEKILKSENLFELDPFSINFIEGWKKH
jgi:hypothetical protein